MVKVSVLYPYVEGGKFDLENFLRQHLPLVDQAWGAALGPQHKELEKEAHKFTDIKPTIRVSQVVFG